MISKPVKISALILIIVSSFFTSCKDDFYPKVNEVLYITNNTSDTLFVKYGFTDSVQNAYQKNIQLIDTMGLDGFIQFDDSLITGLWMTESKFNVLVSQISIYRIQHQDTDFVNPKYYNKKSAWEHHIISSYNHFFNTSQLTFSENKLSICDSMFIK